jgi:hypothetical protein
MIFINGLAANLVVALAVALLVWAAFGRRAGEQNDIPRSPRKCR